VSLIWWGPKGIFANRSSIDENAITEYIKDIQDFFEKRGESDRVLLYQTRSDVNGYDIICPFLGVEKPEGKAWPNVNASEFEVETSRIEKRER